MVTTTPLRPTQPVLRRPTADDGRAVWELVRACKPLDENSLYCNLIQCDHFAETCVLAELNGAVVGWISAHLPPAQDGTVFVWQVAVSEKARGLGLGARMLDALLDRPACADVTDLQTTITADNAASWALFRKLARRRGGTLQAVPHYKAKDHFGGAHATEHMVTIRFADALRRAA